ncbi:MAG: 30S ribosomal protein S8 [Aquificae bacterium]|nr:30S ribosomal protein S8 [Aquificota bacterium]
MSAVDPIADMFSAIKNAIMRQDDFLYVPSSKMKERILEVLKREGFIKDYEPLKGERYEEELKKMEELARRSPDPKMRRYYKQLVEYKKGTQYPIKIYLKYLDPKKRRSAITNIVRVSKGGKRVYAGVRTMPYVKRGLGIAIVSTDAGVMTDHEARRRRKGGEIIAFVW